MWRSIPWWSLTVLTFSFVVLFSSITTKSGDCCQSLSKLSTGMKYPNIFNLRIHPAQGRRRYGAAGSDVLVTQIVRGQHEGKMLPFCNNCSLKHACYWHKCTLRTVFLSNLAQILTSCSKINVISADIRSIFQCTEVYFILPTDEKRTHFTSKVLLTQF